MANQHCYESGLEDLKLICDAYIDKLKMEIDPERIGPYLDLVDERNADLEFCADDVRGISIQKTFIPTKADMTGVSLKPYYIVRPDYFAYVTVTSRNGEKISLAYNNTERTFICSSSYVVFCVHWRRQRMDKISEITRRDIVDIIKNGFSVELLQLAFFAIT